jgi:hypothetical protein
MKIAKIHYSDYDLDSDTTLQKHSRINSKASYEEVIFDMINEIPHYFDDELKSNDDMSYDIKSKRSSIKLRDRDHLSSKSLDRKKNIRDSIRKKSIFKSDSIKCESNTNIKIDQKNKFFDVLSNFEIDIETEKAIFKYEEIVNGYKNIIEFSGYATISDFRIKFFFDEENNYEKLDLSKEYFMIPIFLISK